MPYLAGKNTVVTINGTERGFQGGTIDRMTATDDMTNTMEGGFGRDIGTTKRATFRGTLVFNSDTAIDFAEQDEVALLVSNTGAKGLAGDFLVTRMGNPWVDPGKGVKIDVEMVSQGEYTTP